MEYHGEHIFLGCEPVGSPDAPQRIKTSGYSAEADSAQSESGIGHLRVAEGDYLSERSE